MADDLSWDDDNYEVPEITKVKKFTEDDDDEPAKAKSTTTKKKDTKKKDTAAEGPSGGDEEELDPLAEKLRKQRIVEESDLAAAREAFGGAGKNIDEMVPKTDSEFAEYAELVTAKYFRPFERDAKYVAMLKAALRDACQNLASGDIKELESAVVSLRNAKVKEEKEIADKKKKAAASVKKKEVKVDNELDDADMATGNYRSVDDDYDFM